MATNVRTNEDLLPITRVKGDREPVGATLKNQADVAVDLTGLKINFCMFDKYNKTTKVNAAATIVTAASGTVSYTFASIDVDTVGNYEMYFVDDGANPRRWPFDGGWVLRVKEAWED